MLRITELKLPLDHAEDALRPAIEARLGLTEPGALQGWRVFKRAYDARKKSAIVLIYTVFGIVIDSLVERLRFK